MSKNKKKKSVRKSDKPDKKRVKRRTAKRKKRLIQCLEKFCTISEACEKVRISRETYYAWLDSDKKFNKEIEALDKWNLANAEGKLNLLVNGYKYKEIHEEHTIIERGKGKKKITTPTVLTKTVTKWAAPNERAIEFVATNRNRKRWKNRQELTGEDGEPIAVNILKFSDVKESRPATTNK